MTLATRRAPHLFSRERIDRVGSNPIGCTSANLFDPDSTGSQFGRYGSEPNRSDKPLHQIDQSGAGSPFAPDSPDNPYGSRASKGEVINWWEIGKLRVALSIRQRVLTTISFAMSLIKSKIRVADHGEVFTPPWMVEAMLDLVKGETERIDSRFLEPACGSGNFLVRILQRKLAAVELKFGKSDFEKRHYALLALMCTYGIELLADNIADCRSNMLEILAEYLDVEESDDLYRAASYVLSQNLVHGDALTMRTSSDQAITFAEWGYLGKGKFQRRDFRLDIFTQMSAVCEEGTLFAHLGKHEVFTPDKTYPPMTVSDLAAGFTQDACAPLSKEEA